MITLLSSGLPTVMNIFAEGEQRSFAINENVKGIDAFITVRVPTPHSIARTLQKEIPTQEEFDRQVEIGAAALQTISTPEEYELRYNAIRNEFETIKNNYNRGLQGFKKLKKGCREAEKYVRDMISQIDKILLKVIRIEGIFTRFETFLNFLSNFIPLLKTLIGVAQIAIAAQVGPFVSGAIIVKMSDAIKFVKSKLKEISALVKIVDKLSTWVQAKAAEIRDLLYPVREELVKRLNQIRQRCIQLDASFINVLKELELSMAYNPPTGTDGIGGGLPGTGVSYTTEEIVNILAEQFDPEDILDNLESSTKERFIEYLLDANGFSGYQVIKR